MDLNTLRDRHPIFTYLDYHITYDEESKNLILLYDFWMEPDIAFHPRVVIHGAESLPERPVLENFAFHLGMMELPSYWKCACPPQVVVKAGRLSSDQIDWWKDLMFRGQGEFFYLNDIDFMQDGFLEIVSAGRDLSAPSLEALQARALIPVGGGKDSAVTLSLFTQNEFPASAFSLNATPATLQSIDVATIDEHIRVSRKIDPTLLDLNQQGYLNGHTPFSAYLAFLTTFCAVLFDYRYIALSNERSSNEGNEWFHGYEVNHQYSKTYDFESKFREYSKTYLAPDVEYFSLLRPVYELQIAQVFSALTDYHTVFRSCNRGQKTNTWCHDCPKCLFVYTMLFPFLGREGIQTIFHEDLFAKESLLPVAHELVGISQVKPFECVGTRAESEAAFFLATQHYDDEPLPLILQDIHDKRFAGRPTEQLQAEAEQILTAWNTEHAIPESFEAALRKMFAQTVNTK